MKTALDYFRRCVELCQEHGFGRIEVGNRYMIAWNRLYMNDVAGSLNEALAAVEAAARAGHRRAEMVARLAAGRVLVEMNRLDAAEEHLDRGLAIAESLDASRFNPFFMIYLGRIQLARAGFRPETVARMKQAVEVSRATGFGFLGPWVLGTLALVSSDDPETSRKALNDGEDALKAGCVGHNYFAFYADAMEVALRQGDWDAVDRYADALGAYSRPEPLPASEFFIARGRALARHGRGRGDGAARDELAGLKAEAEKAGLERAVLAIDDALARS